jgi:hypothetical protein
MKIDRAVLEERFRDMSEAEILDRLRTGELTELALEVALAEASQRGFGRVARDALGDAQGGELAPDRGVLKLCAQYLNPMDAQVLAARLQAEGLAPRVLDADTMYASGALFGALASVGVRVMIPESQLEEAKRIRAAVDAGEYAIDEDFDVDR